ncbi:PREDICTED: NADH dehydrogenase [ubiquinone] 1 alpha subcomplex subunit 9, mitochondrial [Polistes canadensis]|uniref:NADH dehydrogenase [ubiquinone] 1 alpha subcomplex subunit 9, mitochondrial n=1 Tax=Polistes canadensis TaxID=91411 RepID=UPI000718CF27|nr:PREDICTED: NADH dehydrogenase [ubiquinone] 1 alpha subcomplex subunit 9, mitochondrial [Polistes canadensis]
MSAVILKNFFQTRLQTIHFASIIVQGNNYSNQPRIIKNPTTASLKRGTGGRSSFNGIVCTIFGNNGFIGRNVCNQLGKIGTQLILPHRSDFYHVRHLKLCGDLGQVLFHEFDLRDEEAIYKCVKHSNVVINLIGKDWETKNFSFEDVHVTGARRLARISKEAGVERFIHVSSLNVSPNPTPLILKEGSQFLKSKWQGECAVKEEFPEATIIRPSIIYGMQDKFLSFYSEGWNQQSFVPVLWKKGEQTEKQPIHISEVVNGISAIVQDLSTVGKTYQFVGPKRYKLRSLVEWIQRSIMDSKKKEYNQVIDLDKAIFFKLKVSLCDALGITNRYNNLHWEGIEKDSTTDVVLKDLPTIEDLDIKLSPIEEQGSWDLKLYDRRNYFDESLRERTAVRPPEAISI